MDLLPPDKYLIINKDIFPLYFDYKGEWIWDFRRAKIYDHEPYYTLSVGARAISTNVINHYTIMKSSDNYVLRKYWIKAVWY